MKSIRIGYHEVRQYKGSKEKMYEIIQWERCSYFEKLQEYLDNGYTESFLGEFIQKDGHRISRGFFDTKEICFVIAWIKKDKEGWYLETVLDRLITLSKDDQLKVLEIYGLADAKLNKHLKL